MKKRICLFDLDGTLVDTLADLADSLNAGLSACGMPELTQAQTSAIIGHSTKYMFQHAVPEGRFDEWPQVGRGFDAHYAKHCCDRSTVYEGVLHTLSQLKKAGVLLACVTNKPHRYALDVLNTLFERDTFNMIVGRMDKFPTKPSPEALAFVLEYFGMGTSDAVYIGDSEVDVQFAANAGVPCLSVSWGFRTRAELTEAGAAHIIDDPEEILDFVL